MAGRLRDPQRGRALPPAPERQAAAAADSAPEPAARPTAARDAVGSGEAPTGDADSPEAGDAVGTDGARVAHDGPTDAVGPLAGTTVLVPRAPGRAASLAALLRTQGATVLVSPAIERAPIEDTAAMDAAVADLAGFAWVVVTSVNAIDELTASAARRGLSLAELSERARTGVHAGSDTRWAAVGPATRRALEGAGVHVDLEASVNSARGLLAAFDALAEAPDRTSPADGSVRATPRVLVPQGDLAKPTMADGLRDRGWAPHVVIAYRTVSHPLSPEVVDAWRAGEVDVVVLTSGSVAREVAAQLGADPRVAGVAIGEPTAEAAHAVGLRIDAVAEKATDDSLAEAVLRVAAPTNLSERASPLGHARSDTPSPSPAVSEPASTPGHARSDNPTTTEGRNHP
ncbi:uroporphyrinogen-III synthase [Oerskovia jenensis]|uniref:Uroporphyrinogen-III synthase n=1 Tax=Oerskovia jenensis TaxID=162169 RepID=A0ABS2LH48_9CELL|nr:uroporphyrinogen-III synthase [Oerskovia jenensis]MBM7479597.1 uroporphyrinogen-III synthase [Oerskovia jenensis]